MREHEAVKAEMISEKQADFKRILDEIVRTGSDLNGVLNFIEEQESQPFIMLDDAAATRRLEVFQSKVILAQDKVNEISENINKLSAEKQAVYNATGFDEDKYEVLQHNLSYYSQKIDRHQRYAFDIKNLNAAIDGQVETKGVVGFRRYVYSYIYYGIYNYQQNDSNVIKKEFNNKKELAKFVDKNKMELEKVLKSQSGEKYSFDECLSNREKNKARIEQYDLELKPARELTEKINSLKPHLAKAEDDVLTAKTSLQQALNLTEKCNILSDLSQWK